MKRALPDLRDCKAFSFFSIFNLVFDKIPENFPFFYQLFRIFFHFYPAFLENFHFHKISLAIQAQASASAKAL